MTVRLCHLVSNHYRQPEQSRSQALNNVPSQVLARTIWSLFPRALRALIKGSLCIFDAFVRVGGGQIVRYQLGRIRNLSGTR